MHLETDTERDERLLAYYERQVSSLMRKDHYRSKVAEACELARDACLPRLSVEFRQDDEESCSGSWHVPDGLGLAFQRYVECLREMERVRFSGSQTELRDCALAAATTVGAAVRAGRRGFIMARGVGFASRPAFRSVCFTVCPSYC